MSTYGIQSQIQARIAEARQSNELSLVGLKLTEFPPAVRKLRKLKKLSLIDNRLTTIPLWIEELKDLHLLDVSVNRIRSLPENLGRLTQLQSLDLFRNNIRRLPDTIGDLRQLRRLDLSLNEFRRIPRTLGLLERLEILDVSYNRISTLPVELTQLLNLRRLDISNNRFKQIPGWISLLSKLESLAINNTDQKTLPEWIALLKELRNLSAASNRIRAIPSWVMELRKIEELDLGNNLISVFPDWIGQVETLEAIDISNNQVFRIPDSIGQLRGLRVLNLSSNRLKKLPPSFARLAALQRLFLHENALKLPPSILGPTAAEILRGAKPGSPDALLAYYFGTRSRGAKPLNEVKLLLVGHGRVGKTSLSKALRNILHNDREPETPGIERYPLELTAKDAKITAHVWDFGGQEFLHQTHQFFFSERSIYVVVLSGRQGQPMQEAEYWLRLIRTYGSGSPVVIALNQVNAHPFTVDEHYLTENYSEVKAVIRTDCCPHFGIDQLRRRLASLAWSMPSVREKIYPHWARVRERLELMKESYMTFARYREICTELGVPDNESQETLATILDCLGIALNYRHDPRLRDTSVLKPRWLVDGIYTILRWLHRVESRGEIRLSDFNEALGNKRIYPPTMHQFLLALMEKFELCFPLEEKKGAFLVPGLLDANQPRQLKKFMEPGATRIQFRYEDVRPPGLIPRFIVRSHTLSARQSRWLRGVVIARGKTKALVRGDHEGRVTDVFAIGPNPTDRVWLTEFILAEMKTLNDKLSVRTFVESDAKPGAWTELEILRDAAKNEQFTRTERTTDGGTVDVDIRGTLQTVETAESTVTRREPLALFICYSHANENTVKHLIPSLKVLARRRHIAPWQDTDLVPGEDWDETIQERLSNARIILFLVSRDFLASHYISEKERPLAMRMCKERRAAVVPILLSPCSWQKEDFSVFENLPSKGKYVSSLTPREKAWALIEDGITKAANKIHTTLAK